MAYYIFSVYLFVMVGRPQEYLPFLELLRPVLTLQILSVVALVPSIKGPRLNGVLKLSESKKYLFFYLIMIIGIPFALYRRQAFNGVFLEYSNNILFFFIFVLANDSFDKLKKSIFLVILSMFVYSIFGLWKGSFIHERFFFGTMFDANDLAYVSTSLLPLPLYYIILNKGRIKQGIAIITFGISVLTTILTGSRTGIIALMITFIIIMSTIKLQIGKKIILVLGLIVILIMYSQRINIDRYLTILDIEEDYNITEETGRLTIWKRGLQIIWENPILGVGAGCFPEAIGRIRAEMNLPQRWQTGHNSYLMVAAQQGLIGLIVFLTMIIGCLKYFYVLSRGKGGGEFSMELQTIAKLLFISTIATSIGGFFLSQAYSLIFTLLFAFSGALRNLNRMLNEIVKDI
jgi:O-antigen ligase